MRLRTAFLSVIPGAAHVDLGRAGRGLLFFFLFALFLNGALIAPWLVPGQGLREGCLLAAAGLWLASLADALRSARRAGGRT